MARKKVTLVNNTAPPKKKGGKKTDPFKKVKKDDKRKTWSGVDMAGGQGRGVQSRKGVAGQHLWNAPGQKKKTGGSSSSHVPFQGTRSKTPKAGTGGSGTLPKGRGVTPRQGQMQRRAKRAVRGWISKPRRR